MHYTARDSNVFIFNAFGLCELGLAGEPRNSRGPSFRIVRPLHPDRLSSQFSTKRRPGFSPLLPPSSPPFRRLSPCRGLGSAIPISPWDTLEKCTYRRIPRRIQIVRAVERYADLGLCGEGGGGEEEEGRAEGKTGVIAASNTCAGNANVRVKLAPAETRRITLDRAEADSASKNPLLRSPPRRCIGTFGTVFLPLGYEVTKFASLSP